MLKKTCSIGGITALFVSLIFAAQTAAALSTCVSITHDMQLESTDANTGGDVSKLQRFLSQQDPLIYPEQKVDGYYGPATRLAVYRWQKANGVKAAVFGNVDTRTRTALGNCKRPSLTYTTTYAYTPARSAATVSFGANGCPVFGRTLSRGSYGSDVQALQSFFVTKNLLSSDSATAYFGALTEHAVQSWQTSAGIISSGDQSTGFGVLGPRTRAALANDCSQTIASAAPAQSAPAQSAVHCLNSQPVYCAPGYVPGGTCNLSCILDKTPPPQWVTDMLNNPTLTTQSPSPAPSPTPSPTPTPTPSPSPTQTPVTFTQNGTAATLQATGISGSYSITYTGTYNANGLCDNAQFNLGYGDETSDTFGASCTAKQYSKTHTFPGPGVYDAYIAKLTTDSNGVQNFDYQAEIEITIANDGTIQMGVVPPDTSASAAQINVASALTALESALRAFIVYLNNR